MCPCLKNLFSYIEYTIIIILLSDTASLGFDHEHICTKISKTIKQKCSKNVPPPNLPLRQDWMALPLNLPVRPGRMALLPT